MKQPDWTKPKHCMRHPRTTQERRVNGKRGVLRFDEYHVHIRGKRSMPNLPEAWDDVVINGYYSQHTSWKKLRRTQYRIVNCR